MFVRIFIILQFVFHSFAINVNFKYLTNHTTYIEKIIGIYNSKKDLSHATLFCQKNSSNFCGQICNTMHSINIPVTVFEPGTYRKELFGKLNILYFKSDTDISSFFERKNLNWGSDLYYVIFLGTRQVGHILRTLWVNFKIRKSILFGNKTTFHGKIFDVISNRVEIVDVSNTTKEELFRFKNFHKTPLRVTIFERIPEVMKVDGEYMGSSYGMMKLMAEKLNFTPLAQDSSDGKKFGDFVNNRYTGGLGDIVYGRSDIAFNGYFLRITRNNEYKYLFPVNLDYVCMVAPKAGKIPKYMVPFMCFPANVWVAMMIAFICVSTSRYLMYYVRKNYLHLPENSNILLALYSIAINFPIPFSHYKYLSSKIILLVFLGQMYVIVTSFQGSLVTLLSIPKYYKDMETLADMNNSQMDIVTRSSTIIQVFEQDYTLRPMLSRFTRSERDFRDFNFSFFARFMYHKRNLFRNFFIKKDNRTIMVHSLEECPLVYYTSYVVASNFPFIDEFNTLIMRVVESGIIMKWDREIISHVFKEYEPQVKTNHNDDQLENKSFTLNDLEVAFMVLLIGCSISVVVFAWEYFK